MGNFRDYWATPEQRERIVNKQKNDRIELEKEKMQKFNSNVVFKEKSSQTDKKEKVELIERPKQKWYEKFLLIIKNAFKKTKK